MSSLRQKADQASKLRCNTLIAVIEYPANIGNIGALIRNIEALGISKLYLITDNQLIFDHFKNNKPGRINTANLKSLSKEQIQLHKLLDNTSSSANRWIYVHPFIKTSDCINHLIKNNYISLGTSPHIEGVTNYSLYETNYTIYKKLAVWFGNEQKGLTQEAFDHCSGRLQIKMSGIVESLNLAVATGIVLSYISHCRQHYNHLSLD